MNTNSTYTIEHATKGVRKTNITFSQVREFAFKIRSNKAFSPVADVDYTVIDEANNERIPMQHIPN
jgi:hypothetical protein